MYAIIWKYKIKLGCKTKFEFEYGRGGSWHKLFSNSKNYHSSCLYKSDEETNTYLLIDIWESKNFYEEFIKTNKKEYQKLSTSFEFLYETEKKIGLFNVLK